jgi:hypothetical protein
MYLQSEAVNDDPNPPGTQLIRSQSHDIPTWDTHELWGANFDSPPGTCVTICTDSSTHTGHPSGAGFVYLVGNACTHEYDLLGQSWTIPETNNYLTELAAVDRCLRSIPVTVSVHISPDSQTAITAIAAHLELPKYDPIVDVAGRPYLLSICWAIRTRTYFNAFSRLTHVRSHTGARDLLSIGNEAADRKAGAALHLTLATAHTLHDVADDLLFELSFTINTNHTEHNEDGSYTHRLTTLKGNIRNDLYTTSLHLSSQSGACAQAVAEWLGYTPLPHNP